MKCQVHINHDNTGKCGNPTFSQVVKSSSNMLPPDLRKFTTTLTAVVRDTFKRPCELEEHQALLISK